MTAPTQIGCDECEVCKLGNPRDLLRIALKPEYESPIFRWLLQIVDGKTGELMYADPEAEVSPEEASDVTERHYLLQVLLPYARKDLSGTQRSKAVPKFPGLMEKVRTFIAEHDPRTDSVRDRGLYMNYDTYYRKPEATDSREEKRLVVIGVAVPIPVALIEDTEYDLIAEISPEIEEAAACYVRVYQVASMNGLW